VLLFWAASDKFQAEEKLPLVAPENKELVDKKLNSIQDPLALSALAGQVMEFKS